MAFIVSVFGGYLIGSIPVAFLVVRWKAGIDIRNAGSGNVGGFNAFRVTASRNTGVLVGVLDGVKGLAASLLGWWIGGNDFWVQAAAMLAAIVGHIYPVWLRFQGGRGLATTAGALFAIGLSFTLVWCLTWLFVYKVTGEILKGNVAATVLTMPVLLLVPDAFIQAMMVRPVPTGEFLLVGAAISALLFVSHIDAVRDMSDPKAAIHE